MRGGGEDQYLDSVLNDYKLTPFPGFREFYWTLKGQEDMKIYIRSIVEFEAILDLEYKQYAIDNAGDVIAQQNFANMKTLLEWDGEPYQPDYGLPGVRFNKFQ